LSGAELTEETRPLAMEARAHVIVQPDIDHSFAGGTLETPTDTGFIRLVHEAFYTEMPPEFCFVVDPDGARRPIVAGAFRKAGDLEIAVGRHLPPSSERVEAFMAYFAWRFKAVERSPANAIIAIAAAHHRLNYIHPFPDGNGRVSRLMSHAMALKAGIGGQGLWSISRGLARGLADRGEYKRMMDMADSPRRGDRDGRGNLSEAALHDFTRWFMRVMLDQIRFTASLFELSQLDTRYRRLVADVTGDKRAPDLISAVLRQGRLPRGDAALVLRVSDVTARKTLGQLVLLGFLASDSPKTPVRLAFPLDYRERLFPNLFADAPV
jgi:Fic family protein